MGEVYSPFVVSSSATKDFCGKGLRGKDEGSLSSIVSLSKPKPKMVCKIIPFLHFSKPQSYFPSFPLPQYKAFYFQSRKHYLYTSVFPLPTSFKVFQGLQNKQILQK